MAVREFAAHLGVSDRMVSKWEAGGESIRPRPVNQAALDTSLARAVAEVQVRFCFALSANGSQPVESSALGETLRVATNLVRHREDDKLMTLVEAGISPLGPRATPTWLAGFYVDVFPTTNANYARFVHATNHEAPEHWKGPLPPPEIAGHPVVGVNWYDAYAYTRWAGTVLPTGQQWEKAARGPTGSTYPWGADFSTHCANVRESRLASTNPVGWYEAGISAYGAYDLCGNVWEWCAADPDSTGRRQVRGGSFASPAHHADPATFSHRNASDHRVDVGFRCVLPLQSMLELLCA